MESLIIFNQNVMSHQMKTQVKLIHQFYSPINCAWVWMSWLSKDSDLSLVCWQNPIWGPRSSHQSSLSFVYESFSMWVCAGFLINTHSSCSFQDLFLNQTKIFLSTLLLLLITIRAVFIIKAVCFPGFLAPVSFWLFTTFNLLDYFIFNYLKMSAGITQVICISKLKTHIW